MLHFLGLLLSVLLTLWQATVNPCLHQRLPNTHKDVWLSLVWGHHSLLLGLCEHIIFVCALQESLLPQSCGSSVIKSHWSSKSDSLRILSPFAQTPGYCFATVREFLWHNCSPVYGLPSWWLYSEANGNLLQEDLYQASQNWLPEPLSPWQASAEPCLSGDPQTFTGMSVSVSCGGHCSFLGYWYTQGFVCALHVSLVGMRFVFKWYCIPPPILLWFLFCPWTWGIFFFWVPTFSCWWLLAASCDFGVLTREY